MMFTSFRRDGSPVSVPVWLVGLGNDEIGFYTGELSGKAKRIKRTPRVTVQACDMRGQSTHGEVYEGSARIVTGAEFEAIKAAVKAKYGLMVTVTRVLAGTASRLRGKPVDYGNIGVVVTLTGGASVAG